MSGENALLLFIGDAFPGGDSLSDFAKRNEQIRLQKAPERPFRKQLVAGTY
jgi:hypothetical protein